MVPSSPNGPCSSDMATSMGPTSRSAERWRTASSDPAEARSSTASAAFSLSSGSRPSMMLSAAIDAGSTETQRPVRVIPMPTTSNWAGSRTPTTPAAVRHDTWCSLLAPPNTTATRVRAGASAGLVAGGAVTTPDHSAQVGALEGGTALSFASGLAASQAVLELLEPGAVVVMPRSCYLGVSAAVDSRAARYGWTVRRVDIIDTEAVLAAAD